MNQQPSLFRRTAVTLAVGLLCVQLVSSIAIFGYMLAPLAQRSAEDLTSILIWSADTWVKTSDQQRVDFTRELLQNQGMELQEVKQPMPNKTYYYPYMRFLYAALVKRLATPDTLSISETAHEQFEVEFIFEGHRLHFSFFKQTLTPEPFSALLWSMVAIIMTTIITAWLLARRITSPIAKFAEAARRIGSGEIPAQLPETGTAEFAAFAQIFNTTVRQLQARRENQTTLLAGISHDLRSPLARLKMALGLLAEECPSPLIGRMERDISAMDQLIGAQLQLARAEEIEADSIVDIDMLLDALIETHAEKYPKRLSLTLGSQSCVIEVASIALQRCISNLLDNALRYGNNGQVQVVRRTFQHIILIGIRDRGPGIPLLLRDKVLRPFYRMENSRNRATGGSGLGLAITKQLVETHGWRLAIRTRYQGGLSVWLSIPIKSNKDMRD